MNWLTVTLQDPVVSQQCLNIDKQQLLTIYSTTAASILEYMFITVTCCEEIATKTVRVVSTARCYASAVPAMGLCPSLCHKPVCSTKTAKRRITQTTPHDTPGSLVFRRQRSPRNSTGVTPTTAPNAGGVVKIGDLRQITGYISKTVKDRHIVSIKVE